MSFTLVIKLVHELSAFGLICGVLGRGFAFWQAERTENIGSVTALVRLAGYFERLLVIPSSFVLLIFGIGTAVAGGWPLFGFLQGAQSNWLLVSLLLTLSIIPVIVFVFLPRGRVFDCALEEAQRREGVTPELKAAFADKYVAAAHVYELAMIFVVTTLMVTKPF
jgi:uncharacterized membrane protein